MQPVSFNDGWRFRPRVSSFLEFFGPSAPWTPVRLPHDAMIGTERDPAAPAASAYFPGGAWEYEKTFFVPDDLNGKRMVVEFEGVYRGAAVYVNETFAGHRPYGYSNFYVRIDEHLRFGADNVIRVEANAHDDSRWYTGAGIYRNTKLIVGERVHIALDGLRITTRDVDDHRAVVEVAVVVENDQATPALTTIATEILDDTGTVVARDEAPLTTYPGRTATQRHRLTVERPRRWSVDRPALYTCRAAVSADGTSLDDETATFGIRTLQLDAAHGLRINGEPVKLRGACVHHDNGIIGATTIERAEERRVELLKAAGFNALRSAHQPMSKAMLDACDRLGMLVMDEAFDVWTVPKANSDYARSFPDWWEADVTAMVLKDVNHPSVILYSIGNEIPETGTPAGAALGRAIAEAIRAIDDSRFITNGINPMVACRDELFGSFSDAPAGALDEGTGVNTMLSKLEEYLPVLMRSEVVGQRTAESFAALDVAGYNYLDSRYELDRELYPNRVIVGTETFPPRIDANWNQVRENEHVIGDFTWTGWDYLGEVGVGRVEFGAPSGPGTGAWSQFMGAYPWLTAWTGDLDITGHRRPISYYREIVFGLRRDPFIAVQRPQHHGEVPTHQGPWSASDAVSSWSWAGFEGKPVTVEVYADADEVELVVNGAAVGRAPAGERHRFRADFETVYEPGVIEAVGYRDGRESGRTALRSAVGPVQLDIRADRQTIRADDTDLAFVDITLVDKHGNLHNLADRAVTVAVEGPAVLQGLGSANPCTEETFGSPTHETFDGRALAAVRPTDAGTISVSVTAEGCAPAAVEIQAL